MTKIMTPSEDSITAGQIGKIQENLGAALRKSGLQSEPTQQILEHQGDSLIVELVGIVRKYVEAVSNLVVRHVAVNRNRSAQKAIDATNRNKYCDSDVVAAMPKGEGEETDVVFFKPGRYISDDELEKEYELHGLIPDDPYSLAAVNEADPAFADEHPNGTHWKDKNGRWCYAAFDRGDDERVVGVSRFDGGWRDDWWFAGRRK